VTHGPCAYPEILKRATDEDGWSTEYSHYLYPHGWYPWSDPDYCAACEDATCHKNPQHPYYGMGAITLLRHVTGT
jgi:hypothetical protein